MQPERVVQHGQLIVEQDLGERRRGLHVARLQLLDVGVQRLVGVHLVPIRIALGHTSPERTGCQRGPGMLDDLRRIAREVGQRVHQRESNRHTVSGSFVHETKVYAQLGLPAVDGVSGARLACLDAETRTDELGSVRHDRHADCGSRAAFVTSACGSWNRVDDGCVQAALSRGPSARRWVLQVHDPDVAFVAAC